VHDRIVSIRGEAWAYKTELTSPLFIEVPVPCQESELSCMSVLEVSILPLSMFIHLYQTKISGICLYICIRVRLAVLVDSSVLG
jgi:hypothetical protein